MMWFFKKKKENDDLGQERYNRIIEIQERISTLRSSLERSGEQNQNTQVQTEPLVVEEEQPQTRDYNEEKRSRELEDIKAKLTGRKK